MFKALRLWWYGPNPGRPKWSYRDQNGKLHSFGPKPWKILWMRLTGHATLWALLLACPGASWSDLAYGTGGGGSAVTVSASALPTGAATSAKQDTAKGVLDSILAALQGALSVTFTNTTIGVTGTFWQATQPVSGPLTDAQLRASAVPVSGTFYQANQPVSGTFWQATQPVSGTFWQATQPVSIAAVVNVAATLAAETTKVIGTVNIAANQSLAVTNAGTFAVQPTTSTPLAQYGVATSSPSGVFSIGNTTGKTLVGKTGTLTTTAKTAGQVVLTYTATAGKILYVTGANLEASATSFLAINGSLDMGTLVFETPSGTVISSFSVMASSVQPTFFAELPRMQEPIFIPGSTLIRCLVTPNTTIAVRWICNLVGYEK
jgi:hypothetical protein